MHTYVHIYINTYDGCKYMNVFIIHINMNVYMSENMYVCM